MPSTVTVHCLFFARYAEAMGRDAMMLELAEDATAGDAVARLRAEVEGGRLIPEHPLVALNREHVALDRRLVDGDELALLPPLAGG